MNLKEMKQRIYDKLDYKPNSSNYEESIRREINDQYQELCASASWGFLLTHTAFQIRKKVSGSQSQSISIIIDDVTFLANIRKIKCVGFTPTLEMEGQTLTSISGNRSYKIVRVLLNTLFIDDNWDTLGGAADNSTNIYDWYITFDRFSLPPDCRTPQVFLSESDDWGEIPFISRGKADWRYLDKDSTGTPMVVIDDQFLYDAAPIQPLTAVATTGGSSTPNGFSYGQKVEYCYTIYREGRESPPCVPVTVTMPTSGNYTIDLSNIDNTGFWKSTAGSKIDSGMQKLIYRRDITNNGRWTLIGSKESTFTTFQDTDFEPQGFFTRYNNASFRFSNTTEQIPLEWSAARQNVSFWFIPDEDKEITFRYYRRPIPLVSDTDTPIIPPEYHQILVDLTISELADRNDDEMKSMKFLQRATNSINAMRRNYLKRDAQDIRMGRWDKSPRSNRRIYGDPTWLG